MKIDLNTNGQQYRNFIAMSEVCQVIERLLLSNDKEDCQSGIFNVGSNTSESVLDMTKKIQQRCLHVLGFEPHLQIKPYLAEESCTAFKYQTERLKLAINHGVNNHNDEIDNLLRYCNKVFGQMKEI